MRRALAACLVVLALRSVLGALEPVHAAPPEVALDGPWALEVIVLGEPEQPRQVPCNPGVDCLTAAKAYFGGALAASYRDLGRWSAKATLGLATLVDQEGRPPSYAALTLRTDLQLELGRGPGRFGAALRLSPTLALGWARTGTAFGIDAPGVALLLGTDALWGELGLPTLPTPADARQFHLAFGFVRDRWSGTAGLGTFATLGYRLDEIAKADASPGLYGDVTVRLGERFELRLMAVLSRPTQLSLGFGWRFSR